MLNSLNSLFEYAFNNTEVEFPIRKLTDTRNKSTDIWKDKVNDLLSYYKENRVNITQGEFQYTFLVDEPDRNLDIDNIEMMYNILSFKKEYTQLICVIHNPILIYKLSKLDYINFVEMTPRYLSKIKKLFKNL
jgi:Fe-S cluster assembly ATPase SufC